VLLVFALASPRVRAADEVASNHRPVKEVASLRISVGTQGTLPLYVSADWSSPLPDITRAVLVLHGRLRNADVYFQSAKTAQAAAGEVGKATIMIVPQFLAGIDVDAYQLSPDTLRWSLEGWEGGDPAVGPAPASSFDALDAILARLSDRRLFPNLRQVVVAGHSGGAQVVQRYAIAGKGELALTREGVGVRYVVANPSSYAYFSGERPEAAIAAACPDYNHWKYGMEARPAYLAGPTIAALEQAYVARRVLSWERWIPIQIIPPSTRHAWPRPRGRTGTCAVMPMPPRCRPATAERRITVFGTCRASGMTATKC
jgi:pimeloyl-ACP methyl ester carboxylesterase